MVLGLMWKGQKLYDPFYSTKELERTGLGLSISYGISSRTQWEIQMTSGE